MKTKTIFKILAFTVVSIASTRSFANSFLCAQDVIDSIMDHGNAYSDNVGIVGTREDVEGVLRLRLDAGANLCCLRVLGEHYFMYTRWDLFDNGSGVTSVDKVLFTD